MKSRQPTVSDADRLFLRLKEILQATAREMSMSAGNDGYFKQALIAVIQNAAGSLAPSEVRVLRPAIEQLLELSPAEDGGLSTDHRARKSSGSYYTPDYIVEYIVKASLRPALARAERESAKLHSAGVRGEDLLRPYLDIYVIDAAVGTGRFLSAAAQEIASAIRGNEATAQAVGLTHSHLLQMVSENCLYGVDLNPAAVEAARLTISVEACGETRRALEDHLRVGDALEWSMPGVARQGKLLTEEPIALDWPGQFPDAFNRNPPGFDAVIGNPPWISFSGRHAVKIDKETRRRFSERWESARGWPSSHGVFLHLAAQLCRIGGRIGQIVPEQLLDLPRYAKAREVLFARARLAEEPVKVDEKAFRGVVGPSCVLVLDRTASGNPDQPARAVHLLTQGGILHGDVSAGAALIIEKMKRFLPLPARAFGDPGVHTGNSADLLIRKAPDPGTVPLRIGKDVGRYVARDPKLWLVEQPRPAEGGYYRIGSAGRYAEAKILIRQTAPYPIAARHVTPGYFRNSLLACFGCDGFSVEYLLAVLNSRLVRFFHQHEYRDGRQQAFPQVKVGHLRSIPIPPPGDRIEELENLAHRMEQLAMQGDTAAMSAVDRQIDCLVYRLYGSTDDEINEVESFLVRTR